ncbi:MAG: hypothetical protein LLG06_11340, partial [Desulfobacteraceae bacterium]|nr:hypothetical protein [Desulfobacteraceae bacterium]
MSAFFRLWVWFSFRQFRHHPWRTLAVLFGIGLGAAVFTSVRLATNASVQAFANSVDAISGKADLTVARPGGRVPEGLVSVLSRVGGVRAASALLTAYVRNEGDDTPLLLVGIDPILDRPFRSWKSEQGDRKKAFSQWGELFRSPKTLLAGRNFLQKNGLSPGDFVRLQSAARSDSFRIVGELLPGGLASLEAGNIAIADIATFQEFMGLFGEVDRIDIILYPDRARETRNEIAA